MIEATASGKKRIHASGWRLALVESRAKPGTYHVRIVCSGRRIFSSDAYDSRENALRATHRAAKVLGIPMKIPFGD